MTALLTQLKNKAIIIKNCVGIVPICQCNSMSLQARWLDPGELLQPGPRRQKPCPHPPWRSWGPYRCSLWHSWWVWPARHWSPRDQTQWWSPPTQNQNQAILYGSNTREQPRIFHLHGRHRLCDRGCALWLVFRISLTGAELSTNAARLAGRAVVATGGWGDMGLAHRSAGPYIWARSSSGAPILAWCANLLRMGRWTPAFRGRMGACRSRRIGQCDLSLGQHGSRRDPTPALQHLARQVSNP